MGDPDRPEKSGVELRRDDWPVEGDPDAWAIEREGSAEDAADDVTAVGREADPGVEWLGFAGGPSGSGAPYLYLPSDQAIYRGQLDPENERVVLREADRIDVESEESLGDHLEALGEERGWSWLSSFAREYLGADQDDGTPGSGDDAQLTDESGQFERRATEFMRDNVLEEADHDLAFSGSHTFADESGRVYVLDRDFEVTIDDTTGTPRATVTVDEQVRVAEEPEEKRRAGDAERIERRHREFEVELDPDGPDPESVLADRLERWHGANVEWSREG